MIMEEKELLIVINTVPLHFDKSINELPDEGVDWGVKKSISDYESGIKPNILMGVQIVVNRKHQGKGLSLLSVRETLNLAMNKGLNKLIIPVRPSDKHKYPLIPMENYVKWKNDNNLPFDNAVTAAFECLPFAMKPFISLISFLPGSPTRNI